MAKKSDEPIKKQKPKIFKYTGPDGMTNDEFYRRWMVLYDGNKARDAHPVIVKPAFTCTKDANSQVTVKLSKKDGAAITMSMEQWRLLAHKLFPEIKTALKEYESIAMELKGTIDRLVDPPLLRWEKGMLLDVYESACYKDVNKRLIELLSQLV